MYKQFGGDTIVDATSLGIGRDPVGLARISRATGVNVIMGGSHYVDQAHPEDMGERAEEEIFEKIVEDVTVGVDGTGIKCGIIGEVGCTWPLTDNERKVLRASARAQQATGAPILIHPGRDEVAPLEIVEVLSEAGADLGQHHRRPPGPHHLRAPHAQDARRERLLPRMGPFRAGAVVLYGQHQHRHAERRQADGRHRLD